MTKFVGVPSDRATQVFGVCALAFLHICLCLAVKRKCRFFGILGCLAAWPRSVNYELCSCSFHSGTSCCISTLRVRLLSSSTGGWCGLEHFKAGLKI